MSKGSTYAGFNMTTKMALERIDRILAALKQMGSGTAKEIAAATGIDKRAVDRYVYHLRETARIVVVTPHQQGLGISAVYAIGSGTPTPVEPEFVHRLVGANNWPRGQEHVRRTGLLAYLFPLGEG